MVPDHPVNPIGVEITAQERPVDLMVAEALVEPVVQVCSVSMKEPALLPAIVFAQTPMNVGMMDVVDIVESVPELKMSAQEESVFVWEIVQEEFVEMMVVEDLVEHVLELSKNVSTGFVCVSPIVPALSVEMTVAEESVEFVDPTTPAENNICVFVTL